uniref:Uncharacterized protein n=1 Tax=Hemiselmis andersenii TaxID=464988 RepID=A0A6U2FD94_HEMAN|mmetsp:Transcript_31423/g.73530  ORF Transcript_31423/g.73530 Transcript_31423/m.73530 type:complete len:144 (-) Transcript_31423:37-468(-)
MASEECVVVRVQFKDEWIVRFHVKSLRELSHSVVSHYYWGRGSQSSGVQPKHVRLMLPSGGELDERLWQSYVERLRRGKGALKRDDMLLVFAKASVENDTMESGRDTLDSDSSVSTMQIEGGTAAGGGGSKRVGAAPTHPELD